MLTQFLPFGTSILTWLLLQLSLYRSPLIWYWAGALLILNTLTAWLLARRHGWLNFLPLPLASSLIVLGYLTIVPQNQTWLVQTIMAATLVTTYLYWRWVYFYLYLPARYTAFSLDSLSFYVNFFLTFLLAGTAYGWRDFLGQPIWQLIAPGMVISTSPLVGVPSLGVALGLLLILYQFFWSGKVAIKNAWPYFAVAACLLLEWFVVLSYLPLAYYLLAFLWAAAYYVIVGLISDKLAGKLDKSKVRLYLILTGLSWLAVLLSARWI